MFLETISKIEYSEVGFKKRNLENRTTNRKTNYNMSRFDCSEIIDIIYYFRRYHYGNYLQEFQV